MSTPLIRVSAENGTKCAWMVSRSCSRIPYCLARTTIERPSGVSSASDANCAASASSRSSTPESGTSSRAWRSPRVIVPVLSRSRTSTSPDASTARPERARTLRRTRRSIPAIPIAERRAPIVVGIEGHEQGNQGRRGNRGAGEVGHRTQGDHDDQEHQGEPDQQDVQRDLVRGLAPLGALDELDHAVEEARPGLLGDLDDDAVREHLGAAGDRAAVAARFADDRRRLAGDRRLVDGCDAVDHRAVAGDQLTGLDDDDVAGLKLGGGHGGAVLEGGGRLGAKRAQRVGLRLAATLGEGLRQVAEDDRRARARRTTAKVNHAGSLPPPRGSPPSAWLSQPAVVITAPTSTTNMTGLRIVCRGSSFVNEATTARRITEGSRRPVGPGGVMTTPLPGGQTCFRDMSRSFLALLLIEREVELEHVHAGLAQQAEEPAVGVV